VKMKIKNLLKIALLMFFVIVISSSVLADEKISVALIVKGLNSTQQMEDYGGYQINYTVFNDYEIELMDVRVLDDELESTSQGDFKVELLDSSKKILFTKNFEPEFVILSDPPTETNIDGILLNFPYTGSEKFLRVYYKDELKLEEDISEILCNKNGVCDGSENYLGCSDCNWYDEDGLCTGISGDYYCDPDCYKDDDCEKDNCNDGDIGGNSSLCEEIDLRGQEDESGQVSGGESGGGGGGGGGGGSSSSETQIQKKDIQKPEQVEEIEEETQQEILTQEEKKEAVKEKINLGIYFLVAGILILVVGIILIKRKKPTF